MSSHIYYVFTFFQGDSGEELKRFLLYRRTGFFLALPPPEASCEEDEGDCAKGSGRKELLGAGAQTHLLNEEMERHKATFNFGSSAQLKAHRDQSEKCRQQEGETVRLGDNKDYMTGNDWLAFGWTCVDWPAGSDLLSKFKLITGTDT